MSIFSVFYQWKSLGRGQIDLSQNFLEIIRLWVLFAAVKEFVHLFVVSVLDYAVNFSLVRNNVEAHALKVGHLWHFIHLLCKEALRTEMVINKTFEDSGFDSLESSVILALWKTNFGFTFQQKTHVIELFKDCKRLSWCMLTTIHQRLSLLWLHTSSSYFLLCCEKVFKGRRRVAYGRNTLAFMSKIRVVDKLFLSIFFAVYSQYGFSILIFEA